MYNAFSSDDLVLLCVLAHPDDESMLCGGTLARYAAEGVSVHLVCATRGERGKLRGIAYGTEDHPGPDGMGRMREAELRAAAEVLGICEVRFLDYIDGQVDGVDPAEAVARIAHEIRRVRPHVVLTFAPDGAYGHPDHIAISQFTTAALVRAAMPEDPREAKTGSPPPHAVAKLYFGAWDQRLWDAFQAAFKQVSSKVDGVTRGAVPWPDWQVTTVIDSREYVPTVQRAIDCHDTQVAQYARLKELDPMSLEELWGRQTYYRALSLVNGGRAIETDLFEGLR